MSAPACTCNVEVDMHRGQGRVILCPLHLSAKDLYEAAEKVAAYGWGTGVSETYHNKRMVTMDALRVALAKARGEIA